MKRQEKIVKIIMAALTGTLSYFLLIGNTNKYFLAGIGILFAFSTLANIWPLLKTIKITFK